MTLESPLYSDIIGRLSNRDTRLFRMQVGTFRALHSEHIVKVGTPGMADIIGGHSLVITPEHVGRRVMQFVAIECKAHGSRASATAKELRARQDAFLRTVSELGGIAGYARSVDEARALLGIT